MDATQLRELIEGALNAQRALEAADAALESSRLVREAARESHLKEVSNLKAMLNGAFVLYGDRVIRVGNNADGVCVVVSPLLNVPVLAPPPPPLPEADTAPNKLKVSVPPLSAGKVPDAARKPGGK